MTLLALALGVCLPSADAANPLPGILPTNPPPTFDSLWVIDHPQDLSPVADPLPRVFVSRRAASHSAEPDLRLEGDRRTHRTRLASDWAAMTSRSTIRDPDLIRDDPVGRGHAWSTDESLRVPLGDTLFLYSSAEVASDSAWQRQPRWLGRTGFGVKLKPWLLNEVQLRGGPGVRYDETDRDSAERSELFIEVTTKVPLPVLGLCSLEYTGSALTAVTATERERLNSNVRFAKPLADGWSELQFGARWWSEDAAIATPWVDRAQLYLGLQLRR
jgi:hypothetical protein